MALKRFVKSLIFAVVLLIAAFGAWNLRQPVYDFLRLKGYNAPPAVASLASDNTFTDKARHIFYVEHPDIEDKTTFRNNCTIFEQTIVLGCYISHRGIFVLKVDDPRLNGVEQVTAAHEFLHAAYDRLSAQEKKRVNALLEQAYAAETNQRIKDVVEQYRAKDPSVVVNELHSILGTEQDNLPPELETYYRQYFNNRAKIVGYSNNYESAFTERKNKLQDYDNQLNVLKKQIDANRANLDYLNQELQTERAQLDSLLAQKDYQHYNSAAGAYNQKVRDYNALGKATNALIDSFNALISERNSLALESQQLFQAIDTRVDTQTAPAQ